MATLGEISCVSLPFSHGNSVQIDSSNTYKTILFTIDLRHVIIYNTEEQHVVRDWTVGGVQLSCPAVLYGEPKQLSVLLNFTTICTWSENEARVEKGKKVSIDQPGYGFWCPNGKLCPYIVYSDGSLASIEDTSTRVLKQQLPPTSNIIWRGEVDENNCHALCLLCQDGSEFYSLVYEWQEGDKLSCVRYSLPDTGSPRTSYSVCYYRYSVYLFLLDGCGHIQRLCVVGKTCGRTDSLGVLTNITLSASIVALDDHQLAVAGVKQSNTVGVGTWDTKYHFLHSFRILEKLTEDSCVYRGGRKLFVTCSDGIYMCNYTPHTATLASAVGALTHSADTSLQSNHINVENGRKLLCKLYSAEKGKMKPADIKLFANWLTYSPLEHWDMLRPEVSLLVTKIAEDVGSWFEKCEKSDERILLQRGLLNGSHLHVLIPALIKKKKVPTATLR